MARLMHFKEAEEIGVIKKGSYVACPSWRGSVLEKTSLGVKETGVKKNQEVGVNPYLSFTFQGISHKNGITLMSDNPMAEVTIGGFDVYESKTQDVGEYFSNYAQQLDTIVASYYSSKSIGVKAWCPQKDDIEGMSYNVRVALEGVWLATPFVQIKYIYGLYFLNRGLARTEPLYNVKMERWMESTRKVAVGISLPDDVYIVVGNYNNGLTKAKPIMWVNLNADNPLAVYDAEIQRLSELPVSFAQTIENVKRERSVMKGILDKSGKEGLLEGNWLF